MATFLVLGAMGFVAFIGLRIVRGPALVDGVHNIGRMRVTDDVEHTFRLRNFSFRTITVDSI